MTNTRVMLILFLFFFAPVLSADHTVEERAIRERASLKSPDCIPFISEGLLGRKVKDFEAKPILLDKDKLPTLVVIGNGQASKEATTKFTTRFMGQVLQKKINRWFKNEKAPESADTRMLLLANLDEVTEQALRQVNEREPIERMNAIAKSTAIADQIAPGLFNRLVRRKSAEGTVAVFRYAYPGIAMGMVAGGILHGGEVEGVKHKGALEELKSADRQTASLSSSTAEIHFGFVLDTKPYSSVPSNVDTALALSSAQTHRALYKRGLFGREKPRRRVWRSGAAEQILGAHSELVEAGTQAKSHYSQLKEHANERDIRTALMGEENVDPLQIAILDPQGRVLSRFSGASVDATAVAKEYQRLSEKLKVGRTNPDDPKCSGRPSDDDSDGVPNSQDVCPATPPGATVHETGTVIAGYHYSGCAEGEIPVR